MYKNILVPIVFDEQHDTSASFKAARLLADKEAAFTVMHVMDDIPGFAVSHIAASVLEASRRDVATALTEAASALPEANVVLTTGHAGRHIADHAKAHGVDCIVIASHTPGLENLFLGSTADWVVRHAKCAVHVMR